MNDKQILMLKNANIREEDFDRCYITDDDMIFTPIKTIEGELVKTGEQLYNEDYLNPSGITPTSIVERVEKLENVVGNIIEDKNTSL